MELDLDTFLTALYTAVDDLYAARVAPAVAHRPGPKPALSDSEVLTLAVCCEWGPWDSERAFYRFVRLRLRALFPRLVAYPESTGGGAACTRPWRRCSGGWWRGWGRTCSGSGCWTRSRSR
jgi:hypothetical protein